MALNLLESPLYGTLFGDAELSEILGDTQDISRMVLFERKLALVQGTLGVIPAEVGHAIDHGLAGAELDLGPLAQGVASSGVPVPALVSELRRHLPEQHGQWLHWGATSQDAIDTAHVLGWQAALDVLQPRLATLLDMLVAQSRANESTVMAGRTRSQIATPITFGLRIAQWAAPLIEAETEISSVREKALRVQFGGASGANTAIAPHGSAIADALADALGLAASPPWHTNRNGPLALANWLLGVSTALDKMAGDLILMMRPEIAEAQAGTGGGSSTMPQKANPVGPETIRVLAQLIRNAHAGLAAAATHDEERDGTAWPLDWVLLPQMLVATGAALRHATTLAETLEPCADRMAATLASQSGVMAEQASFILAQTLPRPEAQALVKQAVATSKPLPEALAELAPGTDWQAELDPMSVVEPCRDTAERILSGRTSNP
ncbi:MAG: lyase family protein [Pseudomonadota bacterium]